MSKMNTQFRIVLLTAVLFLLSGLGRQLLAQTEPSELDQYQLKTSREVLVEYQLAPTPTGARKFLSALLPEATIDPEIEVLVGQLGSDKYDLRRAAEVKLVAKGARALRALTVASKSASTEARVRSRRCIEQIKLVSPSIVRSAIQVLHYDNRPEELEAFPADQRVQLLMKLFDVVDDDLDKRILCAAIFENAGPNSQELVTAGLESDHTSLRLFCVRALPKCFSSLELKKFERLISSDDVELSFEAIRSFGEEFPEASLAQLVRLLEADSTNDRSQAIVMLRRLSGEEFGYSKDGDVAKRKASVEKWKQWCDRNANEAALDFAKLNLPVYQTPRGFLVTVNGVGVTILDAKGKVVRKVDVALYDAQDCGNGRLLVSERDKSRVSLLDQRTGKTIRSISEIISVTDAELLENGNILGLHGTGIVTEHDVNGKVVREFGGLNNPFDVDRLSNGNTIVADSGNDRLVEFDGEGKIVWEKTDLAFPNNVFRMEDGRTLYTTYTSGDVVMLGPDGKELWRTHLDGTLYAVYCAEGEVYVADGGNQTIWVLEMNGKRLRSINIGFAFCDVGFITK